MAKETEKEKVHHVAKSESKPARAFAHRILQHLHGHITTENEKQTEKSKKISYNPRRVGSAGTNTIVCETDGSYDLDYQFVLMNDCTLTPTEIRNIFSQAVKDVFRDEMADDEPMVTIQDSTSVITVLKFENNKKAKLEFNLDFAIVGYDIGKKSKSEPRGESSIIRRNAWKNNQHLYTWNQLPKKHNLAFEKYKGLEQDEKRDVCDEVIQRKIDTKKRGDDKSGFSHFVDVMYERYP